MPLHSSQNKDVIGQLEVIGGELTNYSVRFPLFFFLLYTSAHTPASGINSEHVWSVTSCAFAHAENTWPPLSHQSKYSSFFKF